MIMRKDRRPDHPQYFLSRKTHRGTFPFLAKQECPIWSKCGCRFKIITCNFLLYRCHYPCQHLYNESPKKENRWTITICFFWLWLSS